jgi:hypothetical protein
MKKQKIYEFPVDSPLTAAKRKAVERQIEHNAHLSPKPISYTWDEDDDEVLLITADPILIEVRFQDRKVELYGTAPLWARLLFTKRRKAELKGHIESLLHKTKFIIERKPNGKDSKKRKTRTAKGRPRPKSVTSRVPAA